MANQSDCGKAGQIHQPYDGMHICIRSLTVVTASGTGWFEEGKAYHRHIDIEGKNTLTANDGMAYPVSDEVYEEHFMFDAETGCTVPERQENTHEAG